MPTELSVYELNSCSNPILRNYSNFIFYSVFRLHSGHNLFQLLHLPKWKSCRGNHVNVGELTDIWYSPLKEFSEVSLEGWLEWDLYSGSLNSMIAWFFVTISRCYKDVYLNSFFRSTAGLWNSLLIECFPVTYNLNCFKSRINRHLLTVGSF